MDSSRLYAMGWRPRFTLREGLADAYAAFLGQLERGEARLDVA
jgi:GDP-L-fucose synthase